MLKIRDLDNNSIGERIGLQKDDVILRFDGKIAVDMLDAAFYDSEASFELTVLRENRELTFSVKKGVGEIIGWNFYDFSYIEPKRCANKCVFCFVDQLPKNQRKSLYIKDDDWRLSFVSGNFVTLTNISSAEIERIKEKKFSPLYISVHAADDKVRRFLLGNKNAQPIIPLMSELAQSGITMFTQIVMCPNLNDGAVLYDTLEKLFELFPKVANVAVVPVGMTRFRENLCGLELVEKRCAAEAIDLTENFDRECFKRTGEHFAFCSDEMYVLAERELPSYDYYGDFSQIENGVGLIADLRYQFDLAFKYARAAKKEKFCCVTGVAAAPYISELVSKAKRSFNELDAEVITVQNEFFGPTITVAGLLVGRDILKSLSKRKDIGTVLLPRVMLKENENVFLDGMTLESLENEASVKVKIISDGYELASALLECE